MITKLKLYSKDQIDFILENLKNGKLRFKVDNYSAFFSKSGKYLIQRIDNFMLGLAYNTETGELIFNYPHLSNITDNQLIELAEYAETKPVVTQIKHNGTNLGFNCTSQTNTIHRFRGSIEADAFINEINKKVATGSKTYTGIAQEVFQDFLQKYLPIFKEGQERGFLDDFGNIQMDKIIPELKQKVQCVFANHPNVIGVYGELVSKYNPIAVDGKLEYGLYTESESDYDYHVFDIMYKDEEGNVWLDYSLSCIVTRYGLKNIDFIPLSNVDNCMEACKGDEGVIIKGFKDYPYLKLKHSDVMEWARMMGKLSNVINYSIEHLFSQGLSFSRKEILEENVLKSEETIHGIIQQVWEEIETNNITRQDLIEYFESMKMTEHDIDRQLRNRLQMNLMILVASAVKASGVPKEKLYMAIPEHLSFSSSPLYYDIKREKWRSHDKYGKMLGNVIGKVYLSRKN